MSFSGPKTLLPFYYYYSLALLLIISSIWVFSGGHGCTAGAVRVFPKTLMEDGQQQVYQIQQQLQDVHPDDDGKKKKKQTEVFKEYFKTRLSDVNITATNDTFHDYKRRIPSCPDPLHN